MRRYVPDDARQSFFPVGIEMRQHALKTLTELDIAADSERVRHRRTAEKLIEKHRRGSADGYVRRLFIVAPHSYSVLRGNYIQTQRHGRLRNHFEQDHFVLQLA